MPNLAASAIVAACLACLGASTSALAADPAPAPTKSDADPQVRAAFARAMGVALEDVWRIDALTLPTASSRVTVVAGRYQDGGKPRGGLMLKRPCPGRRCEGLRQPIGKVADVRILALVDLLGAPLPLPLDDAAWPLKVVPRPATKARWPALVLQTRGQRPGGAVIETVRIVDLKGHAAATLAQVQTQQWRRGGFRTRTAALVAAQPGAALDLVLTQLVQRGVCRTRDCIPPQPTEQLVRYRLDRGVQRYQRIGAPAAAATKPAAPAKKQNQANKKTTKGGR